MDNKVRVVPAWKKDFLRHIKNGRPMTVAARLTGAGKSRILQEFRKDPKFEQDYEEARSKKSDKTLQW